jgi:hypothetical protein
MVRACTRRTLGPRKAGEGHFDGVTVQPMIRDDAYRLVLGSSIDSAARYFIRLRGQTA